MKLDISFSEHNDLFEPEFTEVTTIKGETGATFYPDVSEDGLLSWTNDKDLTNPQPVNIKGEKGEKGDTGATGPKGDQGQKGDKGDTGPKGDRGATGPQGIQGPVGPQGPQGIQGPRGETGADGKSAYELSGYQGTQAEWIASLKGEKGDRGPQGATGEAGPQGPQGPQGIQGPVGNSGPQGPEGFSPIVSIQTTDTEIIVTITDINGSHSFTIPNDEISTDLLTELLTSKTIPQWDEKNNRFIDSPLKTSDANGIIINEGIAEGNTSIAGGTVDTSLFVAAIKGNSSLMEKINESPMSSIILAALESGTISASTLNTINTLLGTNYSIVKSKATGTMSISLGTSNESTEVGAITFGYGNKSSGFGSSAIGSENNVSGAGALAYGYKNTINGDFGVAFGQENEVGYSALAVGVKNTALEKASVALGNKAEAVGEFSFAQNNGTRSEGKGSHAQGYYSKSMGDYSDAAGYKTTAVGKYSSSAGESTNRFTDADVNGASTTSEIINAWNETKFSVAKGRTSHVDGKDCLALGDYSTARGYQTIAKGWSSYADGQGTEANGTRAIARGHKCIANGEDACAGGKSSKAKHTGSFVYGRTLSTSRDYQVVFGEDNKDNADALLIVGMGDYTKGNAFEVLKTGEVIAGGKKLVSADEINISIDSEELAAMLEEVYS